MTLSLGLALFTHSGKAPCVLPPHHSACGEVAQVSHSFHFMGAFGWDGYRGVPVQCQQCSIPWLLVQISESLALRNQSAHSRSEILLKRVLTATG